MKLSEFIPEFFTNNDSAKRIYTGKEYGCRCGCNGTYFDIGSKGYSRARNAARKIDPEVLILNKDSMIAFYRERENRVYNTDIPWAFCPDTKEWIDIVLPENKTITLYFTKD